MIDKTLVRERFKKNLKTYKDNSVIQKKMADRLISIISNNPKSILELGCGTGVLTEKLINKYNFIKYNASDIVLECEPYIKKISDEINFIQSDIEEFEFKEKYDLIISNATFQWIENLEQFINKIKKQLNPNGELIFSTFGEDNLKEINNITNVGLKYFSLQELKNIFNPFEIIEEKLTLEFSSAKDVLKHLKLTGVNSIKSKHWTKSDLIDFENKYKEICPDKIQLTYHPIYIKL